MATDNRNMVLEINGKNEVVRISRNRQTAIATLSADNKTLTWKTAQAQADFHKSVEAFLPTEGITIETVLLEGQKPDVVPADAPPQPAMHKMQGELTPAWLEWLMKYKPIAFQNLLGVKTRPLAANEKPPTDPRELWVRAQVIRTDTRPVAETQGGQYISIRFKMDNQIIARRASHLTFTDKEVFRGDTAVAQAEPYSDPYLDLEKMEKQGKIEIVSRKNAAASAGSNY